MEELLVRGEAALAPMVLAELLGDSTIPPGVRRDLERMCLLELTPGYWVRAGRLRAGVMKRGYKPKLVDTLIAQLCIDHRTPLLTRDRDFRPFAKFGGLMLAV
jgi:predicted nucleic acid-binding protein